MKDTIKTEFKDALVDIMTKVIESYKHRNELINAYEEATGSDERERLQNKLNDEVELKDRLATEFFALIAGAKMYAPKNSAIHKLNANMLWKVCVHQQDALSAKETVKFALEDCRVWDEA